MIELPEAVSIARQITDTLAGKTIAACERGNAPHKFAGYSGGPEMYAEILPGRVIGPAVPHGGHILIDIDPGYTLVLGGGGERIIFHESAATLPAKHQFLLSFTDGTYLSVTVQMWGSMRLYVRGAAHDVDFIGPVRVSPLDATFTREYFDELFATLEPEDKRAVKFFIISKPGIWGVGNGYAQDMLLRARLHPRRRAISLTTEERDALYAAVRGVIGEATLLGGRDSEVGLRGQAGGYARLLGSDSAGQPCPQCGGGPIVKFQFLGGACYVCPQCQR